MADNESLLKVTDIAKRLNIPVRTVYYLLNTKKLAGVKIGGRWRMSEEKLKYTIDRGTATI